MLRCQGRSPHPLPVELGPWTTLMMTLPPRPAPVQATSSSRVTGQAETPFPLPCAASSEYH